MKKTMWMVWFIILIPMLGGHAQTAIPTVPPPSLTAPAFSPRPTPTPTHTPASSMPAMPALQPLTRDNIGQVVPLVVLKCPVAMDTAAAYGNVVKHIVWSPTENVLAIIVYGNICLYDLEEAGSEPLILPASDSWHAVFSPDGQTLATLHNGNDVRLWESTTGEEIANTLEAVYSTRLANPSLAYSPDGSVIATVGFVSGMRLYDAETEAILIHAQIPYQTGVYFNGDGKRLVTVADDGISLWTLHPGPSLFRDKTLPFVNPDTSGNPVWIGGTNGNLVYYRDGNEMVIYDLELDQELDRLSLSNSPGLILLPDGTLSPLYEAHPFKWLSPAFTNTAQLAFSAGGLYLATIPLNEGLVQIWGVPQ